jgi:REP element-mobilizing transposase RayT
MTYYDPRIHNRRSIRLKNYDYSTTGLYFITICCQDMAHMFGHVANGEMVLNDPGKIANQCWLDIPNHFTNVILHEHVIMPNHVHGIIELAGENQHSPETTKQPKTTKQPETTKKQPETTKQHHHEINMDKTIAKRNDSANNIVNGKIGTKMTYVDVGANGVNGFIGANVNGDIGANVDSPLRSPSKTIGSVVRGFKIGVTKWMRQNTNIHAVWQRNYYDIIIRDQRAYENITKYIQNNPAKWHADKFNQN